MLEARRVRFSLIEVSGGNGEGNYNCTETAEALTYIVSTFIDNGYRMYIANVAMQRVPVQRFTQGSGESPPQAGEIVDYFSWAHMHEQIRGGNWANPDFDRRRVHKSGLDFMTKALCGFTGGNPDIFAVREDIFGDQ